MAGADRMETRGAVTMDASTQGGSAFVGRAKERELLAEELRSARTGRPRVVWIEGPSGIGKSAFVRTFVAEASPEVILWASGDVAEGALPWGALGQLARSGRGYRCEPLRALQELEAATDTLAVGQLILDAMGELQGLGTVVVVVDDLQWADSPSAEALRFALRRLAGDQVLAVLLARLEEPVGLEDGWRRLIEAAGSRVRLGGLDPSEVAALASAMDEDTVLSDAAAQRLWEHTEGNPLYLRQLLEELDHQTLTQTTGPLPAPRSLAGVVQARLSDCSAQAEALVAATAVLGLRCPLAQAVAVATIEDPAAALTEAVAASLLAQRDAGDTKEVGFVHSLIRSAIYDDLSPARRTDLHSRAAVMTAGTVALGHRLAAACGPDEILADDLEREARAESATGSEIAAARHLAQAAWVSTSSEQFSRRLLEATGHWLLAGEAGEVGRRRSELEALAPTPRRDYLLGILALSEGQPRVAKRCLRAAWTELGTDGGGGGLAGLVAISLAAAHNLELEGEQALAWVLRAEESGASHSATAFQTGPGALMLAGRTEEGLAYLDAAIVKPDDQLSQKAALVGRGLLRMCLDDLEGARIDLEAALAPGSGATGFLVFTALVHVAEVHYRLGALDDATVTADLALSVGHEAGRGLVQAAAKATYPAAARGDWVAAEAHVELATDLAATSESGAAYAATARWALALARDDVEQMSSAALAFAPWSRVRELGMFCFGPMTAEAKIRSGRLDEAESELAWYEAQARRLGRSSAIIGATLVRGELEFARGREAGALRALEDGLMLTANLPGSLQAARLHATYGSVLARFGHRARAVMALEDARARFATMGARPYRERVEAELADLGRPQRRPTPAGELTPTEAVVARLVASGLSNNEVAARLVVSRKAVEYHLGNIYPKVGISTRGQLAARLGSLGTKRTPDQPKD